MPQGRCAAERDRLAHPHKPRATSIHSCVVSPSDSTSIRSSSPWNRREKSPPSRCGTEQPGAVGHRPHLAVDPGVGEAHHHLRGQPSAGKRSLHRLLQDVPQRRVGPADGGRVVHDDLHVELVVELAERGPQVGVDVVRCARRAGCGCRRRARRRRGSRWSSSPPPRWCSGENVVWVQAWRCAAAPALGIAASTSSMRSGSISAARSVVVDAQGVDPLPPQLVHAGRRAVLGQPAARPRPPCTRALSRPERHRPVAGGAPHPQPAPGHPLLGDVDADPRRVGRAGVQPPVLGEHVVGPHGVGDGGPPSSAPRSADPIPRRPRRSRSGRPRGGYPVRHEVAEGDRHRRGQVQHVDRAAAPHLGQRGPVPPRRGGDQLAAERITAPAGGVGGHDVGVAHEAQAGRRRVGAAAGGPRASPGRARPRTARSPRRGHRGVGASTSTLRASWPEVGGRRR